MVESLLVVALLALGLVWINSKSKDKEIERLNYRERHRTGNLNEDDKREIQYLRDSFHFRTIYREVKEDDMKNLDGYFDGEFVLKRAKQNFKEKYGYEFEPEEDFIL